MQILAQGRRPFKHGQRANEWTTKLGKVASAVAAVSGRYRLIAILHFYHSLS